MANSRNRNQAGTPLHTFKMHEYLMGNIKWEMTNIKFIIKIYLQIIHAYMPYQYKCPHTWSHCLIMLFFIMLFFMASVVIPLVGPVGALGALPPLWHVGVLFPDMCVKEIVALECGCGCAVRAGNSPVWSGWSLHCVQPSLLVSSHYVWKWEKKHESMGNM